MSISTNFADNKLTGDALTSLLESLRLHAEVYLHSDFCGIWGVDTSGRGHLPFHLISGGQGWLHQDGNCLPLNPGDLVLFPGDAQHVVSGDQQTCAATELVAGDVTEEDPATVTSMICGYFALEGNTDWPLLDSLPPVIVIRLSDSSCFPETRQLIQLMIAELERAEPGHQVIVDQLAKALFVQILRMQIAGGDAGGLLAALFDPQIGRALQLIHDAPEQHWTLDSLARASGVSRTVLANRFRDSVGSTPMRYLAEWRMRKARELLLAGEPTARVAEQVGYASDASFRKAFRDITGETPGKLRRKLTDVDA